MTRLTDTVGQFLNSTEFPDFIDPGPAIPPLRAVRGTTFEEFMNALAHDQLDLCGHRDDVVAAIVEKGNRLREFCRSLSSSLSQFISIPCPSFKFVPYSTPRSAVFPRGLCSGSCGPVFFVSHAFARAACR